MAVTERDNATAAQKCDPYTVGYEDCESFLRGEQAPPTITPRSAVRRL